MLKSTRSSVLGGALACLILAACGSNSSYGSTNTKAPAAAPAAAPTTAAPTTRAAPAAGDPYGGAYGGNTDDGSTPASAPASTPGAASGGLTIEGFAFSPLTVKAGETFTITNNDSTKHTVTADDGSFSVTVDGGKTAQLSIPKAGTYKIHCQIHSSMKGTIVVQ